MNQIRDWTGKCQRCSKEAEAHTMSMLDVSLVCIPCHESEMKYLQNIDELNKLPRDSKTKVKDRNEDR